MLADLEVRHLANLSQRWCEASSEAEVKPTVKLERLGKMVPHHDRTRPLRMVFSCKDAKHIFLKFSEDFRAAGIRPDDDLTSYSSSREAI